MAVREFEVFLCSKQSYFERRNLELKIRIGLGGGLVKELMGSSRSRLDLNIKRGERESNSLDARVPSKVALLAPPEARGAFYLTRWEKQGRRVNSSGPWTEYWTVCQDPCHGPVKSTKHSRAWETIEGPFSSWLPPLLTGYLDPVQHKYCYHCHEVSGMFLLAIRKRELVSGLSVSFDVPSEAIFL